MAKTLVVKAPDSDLYAMIVYGTGYTEVRLLRRDVGFGLGPVHVHTFKLPEGKGSAKSRVEAFLEWARGQDIERIKRYVA